MFILPFFFPGIKVRENRGKSGRRKIQASRKTWKIRERGIKVLLVTLILVKKKKPIKCLLLISIIISFFLEKENFWNLILSCRKSCIYYYLLFLYFSVWLVFLWWRYAWFLQQSWCSIRSRYWSVLSQSESASE